MDRDGVVGLTNDRNLNQFWHLPVLAWPQPQDNSKNEHIRQGLSLKRARHWTAHHGILDI